MVSIENLISDIFRLTVYSWLCNYASYKSSTKMSNHAIRAMKKWATNTSFSRRILIYKTSKIIVKFVPNNLNTASCHPILFEINFFEEIYWYFHLFQFESFFSHNNFDSLPDLNFIFFKNHFHEKPSKFIYSYFSVTLVVFSLCSARKPTFWAD